MYFNGCLTDFIKVTSKYDEVIYTNVFLPAIKFRLPLNFPDVHPSPFSVKLFED